MTEVLHTSGPFRVEHMSDNGHFEIVTGKEILAEVYYDKNGENGRAKYDAHLFAAAPDMLAALKQCRSVLQTCQHEIKDRLGQHVIGSRIAVASEAITKAEGVQTPDASTHLTHISEGLPHG